MKRYRWGILGTGVIASKFAKDLKKIPAAVLHSVHSRTYSKAEAFAKSFGFKTTHRELKSFLADPALDIVYIATPNHLHCKQAIECMEAGKHVLVEKPFALNVDEAKEIVNAAGKNDRFCMEAMWSRFFPVYKKVQQLVEQKKLGELKLITAEFGIPFTYNPNRFRFSPGKGGGSLMDLGVYPISLIHMFLKDPDGVSGECRKAESGVDVLNRITLDYKKGPIVDIRSSFECKLANGLSIIGDKGRIDIPAPIYSPDKYILSYSNSGGNTQPVPNYLIDKIPLLGKVLKRLKRRIPSLNSSTVHLPFEGFGYGYEALEVMKMLEKGEKESPQMPLSDSISVLKITDELRTKWGIHFPAIDKKREKIV